MRLLFITSTRIGDAVLSTGLLDHLLIRHPGAEVTVAAGRLAAPLFSEVPGLQRLIAIDKQPANLHWLKLWAQTLGHRWDTVVDLRASAIAYALRARRRVTAGRRNAGCHRVEELAAYLALEEPPAPRVWLSPNHEAAARERLPDGAPLLAMGPAANWSGKQWRAENFAALAQRLVAPDGLLPGGRLAVFAAGHERSQADALLQALPSDQVIDLVGKLDLLNAAACLRRAALFIGNDSGLMHLAAAAGAPTLGLFGPSPAERYAPWGPKAAFVRTPQSEAELTGAPGFDPRTTGTLMDGLSVDAAYDGAAVLLAPLN